MLPAVSRVLRKPLPFGLVQNTGMRIDVLFKKVANAFAAQIVLFPQREGSGEESRCPEVACPLGGRVWADWEMEMRASAFIDHLCAKHFIYTVSFHSHSNPMRLGMFYVFCFVDEGAGA